MIPLANDNQLRISTTALQDKYSKSRCLLTQNFKDFLSGILGPIILLLSIPF